MSKKEGKPQERYFPFMGGSLSTDSGAAFLEYLDYRGYGERAEFANRDEIVEFYKNGIGWNFGLDLSEDFTERFIRTFPMTVSGEKKLWANIRKDMSVRVEGADQVAWTTNVEKETDTVVPFRYC